VSRYHLDTDYLIRALSRSGAERERLGALVASDAEIEMSALAWYEFERGPRTPQQLAVGRRFVRAQGVLPFDEERAGLAADLFRRIAGRKRHGVDVAIAAAALERQATLLTCNVADYADIDGLVVERPH
jgi:predicted nucleic acid-binding protein